VADEGAGDKTGLARVAARTLLSWYILSPFLLATNKMRILYRVSFLYRGLLRPVEDTRADE
jgi:hypothetical protein